jgi:hypothetical protein
MILLFVAATLLALAGPPSSGSRSTGVDVGPIARVQGNKRIKQNRKIKMREKLKKCDENAKSDTSETRRHR